MGLRAWEYANGWVWEWVSGSTLRAGGGNGSQDLGVRAGGGMGVRTWEYAKGWGWEWVSGPGSTPRAGGGSQGLGVR